MDAFHADLGALPTPHGRTVRRVEELDTDTLQAIREAEVPAEFAHLDTQLGLDNTKT